MIISPLQDSRTSRRFRARARARLRSQGTLSLYCAKKKGGEREGTEIEISDGGAIKKYGVAGRAKGSKRSRPVISLLENPRGQSFCDLCCVSPRSRRIHFSTGGTSVVHVAGQKDAFIKQRFSFCAFVREFNSSFPFLLACICSLPLCLTFRSPFRFQPSMRRWIFRSRFSAIRSLAKVNISYFPVRARECLIHHGCAGIRKKIGRRVVHYITSSIFFP